MWYRLADMVIRWAYLLRYWVYAIIAGAAILAVLCFVFLMCASGRRAGYDTPQPGWGTWVPVDVLALAVLTVVLMVAYWCEEALFFRSDWKQMVTYGASCLLLGIVTVGFCMSMALRFKLGSWWKNSVLWYCLHAGWRCLRWLRLRIGGAAGRCMAFARELPLVWKTALILLGVFLLEVIIIVSSYHASTIFLFWCLTRPVNRIGEGMTAAVEQRLRSERMKTELITNVSHDIKTPLTSIINYADLISQEPCENETICGYAGVLKRQSERLKRLLEDLVEASKLSTGNLKRGCC